MSETDLLILYAIAGGSGIVLALVASLLIDMLDRRGRFFVFGWLEDEGSERRRLSVYVDNQTNARIVITEAGMVMQDRRRVAASAHPPKPQLLKPLPLKLDAHDFTVVCVFSLQRQQALEDLAACYVTKGKGELVTGQIYRQADRAQG
jgi:hypothetical protein